MSTRILPKLSKSDQEALDDYKAFRRARAKIFVRAREWSMMSKKTKHALATVFEVLAEQELAKQSKKNLRRRLKRQAERFAKEFPGYYDNL